MTRRVAQAVAETLTDAGVRRVWGTGAPVDGVSTVVVAEPSLTALFGGADAALHGTGCSTDGSGTIRLHAAPGGAPEVHVVVDDARLVREAVRRAVVEATFGTDVTVEIDVDPAAPCPAPTLRPDPKDMSDGDVGRVVAVLDTPDACVVVGPGVLRDGAVVALRALAAAAGVGVLNTWGAKGLFVWSDPHHLATAGLQRDDFALAGVRAGSFVAVGLDPAEAPGLPEPAVTVAGRDLDGLVSRVRRRAGDVPVPPLRTRLEALVSQWWAAPPSSPPAPAALVRAYATWLGPDGLVASEAGDAGFWVARTFPTVALGQAVVPARRVDGVAAAVAFLARLDDSDRRVLAVVDAAGPVTDAVVDIAALAGRPLTVARWDDGTVVDLDDHLAAVDGAHGAGGGEVRVGVDGTDRSEIEAVAGPVVAWGDPTSAQLPRR